MGCVNLFLQMTNFNERRVDRISRFVENLVLWEGRFAGRRFRLRPFQRDIIRGIYGPADADGNPLVQRALIWLPRGVGKTTLASALSDAHFLGPEAEAGGQVVIAATDRDTAGIAFNHSWQMIKRDPFLAERVDPLESRKLLRHPGTGGSLQAIASESYSSYGLSCSLFLADEVHAWKPTEAQRLWNAVTDSMVKREFPLTIMISTAGYGDAGLAYDLWEESKQIASGERNDPRTFVYMRSLPNDADWEQRETWQGFHPGIQSEMVNVGYMMGLVDAAKGDPVKTAALLQFHGNVWQQGSSNPWIDIRMYDNADDKRDDLSGRACWMGVDLSATTDLTAVAMVFPDHDADGTRRWDVLAHFWLPADAIQRKAEIDRADYLRWAQAGWLTLTEGNVIDHRAVFDWIIAQAAIYDVREVGIDRALATWLNTQLLEKHIPVVQFGQGFLSMAAPVREIKRSIMSGSFRHGGNPVLRMCFANVTARTDDAENEKFIKGRATGRIDGAVAAAIGIGRAMGNENEPVKSFGFSFI